MSAGKHTFKHTDATRLIKAARAAGEKIKGVTLKDGVVRLEIDSGSKPADEPNDWAGVVKDAPSKKRAS